MIHRDKRQRQNKRKWKINWKIIQSVLSVICTVVTIYLTIANNHSSKKAEQSKLSAVRAENKIKKKEQTILKNSMVDYRMKLATQLVVNKKRHSA